MPSAALLPAGSSPHPSAAAAVLAAERLAALRRTALLEARRDGSFDRFTRLASRLLGTPVALVSLVDADRQVFVSSTGLPDEWAERGETPLTHSFCQHVVAARAPLLVEDARVHPVLATNGAVDDLGVVAYLGVPIEVDGQALGSLCAIDGAPRAWTPADRGALEDLADALRGEIGRRAALADADAARRLGALLLAASPDAFVAVDAGGRCTYASDRVDRALGAPAAALLGERLLDALPPAAREALAALWADVRAAGVPVEADLDGGDGRWLTLHGVPLPDGGLAAAARDISARKQAEARVRASEARFRAVTDTAADAIVTADGAGRVVYWNAAAERIFGYPADEVIGRPVSAIIPARHRAAHDAGLARVTAGGESRIAGRVLALDGQRRGGEVFPIELSMNRYHVDGAPYYTSIVRDASEARRREAELRASEARYRALVEQSPEPVFLHRAGRVAYANASAARLLGAPDAAALTGHDLLARIHPDDRERAAARLAEIAAGASSDGPRPYRATRLDGAALEVELVSGVIDLDGAPAVQTLVRDVTERNRLARELSHQALHDPLTDLANRALFLDRLGHALARRASGRGADASVDAVAVICLDVDDFKNVNDSLGHSAGDAMLREVAERLRRATRGCDTVARLGGDEFAVLLDGMTAGRDASVVVERIGSALARPVVLGDVAGVREVRAGASVGVAYARGGESAEELLRDAEVAMYRAKGESKGGHAVFEPSMHAALVTRLQLEAGLRAALEAPAAAGLWVAYQPIVDLPTGQVRAFEALARWDRPAQDGLPARAIPPAEFVPVAEASGLAPALGRWVLYEACAQLARWRASLAAAADVRVSVNVSGRQLQRVDALVDDVRGALAAAGLPPDALLLEMTETVLMARTEEALARLAALKALGVGLAIDDFGTGYSSLSYLQRFPVDVLKIDKAFVDGVAAEPGDAAIARTVVALGRSLGLRVVAEGVEQEAQRAALAAMGCAAGQGYLFARPLPAGPAGALLAAPALA